MLFLLFDGDDRGMSRPSFHADEAGSLELTQRARLRILVDAELAHQARRQRHRRAACQVDAVAGGNEDGERLARQLGRDGDVAHQNGALEEATVAALPGLP